MYNKKESDAEKCALKFRNGWKAWQSDSSFTFLYLLTIPTDKSGLPGFNILNIPP